MSQLDALSPVATPGFPSTEQRLGLYPVVDSLLWIERLLAAGVTTLQLRIKKCRRCSGGARYCRGH